jgi:hypothetical protein
MFICPDLASIAKRLLFMRDRGKIMPRVFSIEMLDEQPADEMYDDEDYDPYRVAPDAFQYLAAPHLGGPMGPVRVAVHPSQAGNIDNGPDAYERYAGRNPRARDEWAVKAEGEAARFAAEMRTLGTVRVYIRYDGGNDEGFAWFDHCVMEDGSARDADSMAKDLEAAGIAPQMQTWGGRSPTRNALDDLVACTWAIELLGQGYGTGEYVMYGAFWVDLESGLATDDPDPAPVTRNITLKTQ